MHPEDFAKTPKSERVELIMKSGAINHICKGRPILFAKDKDKPIEEDDEFVVGLSFMEGLDSRTSLSQPQKNGVNTWGQARVDQAQFQSPIMHDDNDYKGPFISCFGQSWTCFKA